ncbi:MAG: polysaccharide export protein [Gemmatimonadetes bacterium]|nr:polysaccharide export protein [Gemmatimonadota bacterium]
MRNLLCLLFLAVTAAPTTAQDQDTVGSGASYMLRPGDVLQIVVWGQEEYSGSFKVDETGKIPYPVLGEIDTRGKTMAQIRDEIRAALSQIFNAPFVTVTPQFNIAVLGEVRNPGLFPVDPTQTVLDIVAMAGGPNPNGNINKIRLLRGGQTLDLRLERDRVGALTLQEVGLRSGDQIMVARRGFTGDDLRMLLGVLQLALSVAILISVQ